MSRLALDLHELAAEHERDVAVDPARAWAAGRRRRLRARLGAAGAVAVVLVGGGLGLAGLPRIGGDSPAGPSGSPVRTGVEGHPLRVDRPWFEPGLGDRPGAQAGVMAADGFYHVVDADGSVSRLPRRSGEGTVPPVLSDDGTRLAYLEDDDSGFVVHDLVTGDRLKYPQVGAARFPAPPGELYYASGASFFSPDGSTLLVTGSRHLRGDDDLMLLDADGSVEVEALEVPGNFDVAGWLSDDQIAWVGRTAAGREMELLRTDRQGRVEGRTPLPGTRGARSFGPWNAALSPDAERIAVRTRRTAVRDVSVYEVGSGRQLVVSQVDDQDGSCRLSWAARHPSLFSRADSGLGTMQATTAAFDDPSSPELVTSPRWDASCATWASAALAGPAHAGLFGDRTATWTWWWREELVALGVSVAVLARLVLRRRRRRLAAPVSAGPAPGSG